MSRGEDARSSTAGTDSPTRPVILLAGGRSRRFDSGDKALATVDGAPMARHVADRIAPVTDALVVSCRRDQHGSLAAALEDYPNPIRFVADPVPDRGPLTGIQAGLPVAGVGDDAPEYALVLACDLPLVSPALVEHLFDVVQGRDAAVPRVDGWRQPTYAVYNVDALRVACRQAADRGDHRVRAVLDDLDVRLVDDAEVADVAAVETFHDVDTDADRAATLRRLQGSAMEGDA